MVTYTSKLAYKQLIEQHKINPQEKIILSFFYANAIGSRRQIAKALNIETSTVSARVNGLIQKRILKAEKIIQCPETKKHVQGVEVAV